VIRVELQRVDPGTDVTKECDLLIMRTHNYLVLLASGVELAI